MLSLGRRPVSQQVLLPTVLAALGWIGCDDSLPAAPPGPSRPVRLIVEAGPEVSALPFHRPDQLLLVWIKNEDESDCGTVFIVTAETVIRVRKPDGSVERGGLEDLAEGERVQVWAQGAVEFSCPGLGDAAWILVLR